MTWRAQYQQNDNWYDMTFNNINFTLAPGGTINASGTDQVGEFTFIGSFDQSQPTIRIVKKYIGKHQIYYEGALNNQTQQINGHWGFQPGNNNGKFRMKKF